MRTTMRVTLRRALRIAGAAGLALLLCGSDVTGQSSGRGYLQAGFQGLDLDELNLRLLQLGVPAFDEDFISLGGGGHAEIGRLLIGGEGHGLIEKEEIEGDFERSLSGGFGFFDLGYLVVKSDRVRLYPLVGLGGGGLKLDTDERVHVTFDEVILEPRRGSEISIGGMLVQAAGGLEYFVTRSGGRRGGGFVLGLRGGYIFDPAMEEWELNGADIAAGPEDGMEGWYVRLTFGAGGR